MAAWELSSVRVSLLLWQGLEIHPGWGGRGCVSPSSDPLPSEKTPALP